MSHSVIDGLRHTIVQANEIRLHCVEAGEGPLVLMVHGFPESWYSWRHQLPTIAQAGYRAVAIDVRGYGRSSKPVRLDAYRLMELIGDVVQCVGALGEDKATLVGHDWGAPIVWNSALLRPDLFRGVAGLSVPYQPFGPTRPSEAFRAIGGEEEFYIEYFQEPGRAEREIEGDVRSWLLGFYVMASGDVPKGAEPISHVSPGGQLRDRFLLPDTMPEWLSAEDLDFYSGEFERSGFTGPLNRYRCVDLDWRDFAALRRRPIEIPALFLGGDRDGPTIWGASAIERFDQTLPRLHDARVLEECGHWVQQEKPDAVNRALIEFLEAVH